MADAEWEPFKLEIERLYCHENKTLRELMQYMASKHGLEKSLGQYQRQLKKWDFRKSLKSSSIDWNFIGLRIEKRKRHQHKDSEVHVNGVQLPPQKLKRAKYREAYIASEAVFSGDPSPGTPEGIIVCTPATPGMDIEWNLSLPWLRFARLLRPEIGLDPPSPSSSLTVPSPQELNTSSRTVNQDFMQRLGSIVPWNKLRQSSNIHSSSRTATALRILMPEEFEGQHLALSLGLSESKQMGRDRLSLELYLLSNNLISHGPGGRSEESTESADQRVMEIFNESGWNNSNHLPLLISSHEPTAAAIAEKIFASALRLLDLKTVKRMLEAKMDPNTAIETWDLHVLTPLQFASRTSKNKSMELTQLLLTYGADVSLSYNGRSPLSYAIEKGRKAGIYLLLSHGAIVTSSCVSYALFFKINDDLARELIDACSNVNEGTGWQGRNLLAEAVECDNVPLARLLLEKGVEVNELFTIYFDETFTDTTVLGLATRSKSWEMMQLLLEFCENVNPNFNGLPYVSPLALAVEAGHIHMSEILLRAGVSVEFADDAGNATLIERAVKKKNLGLCQVLVSYGARINVTLSDTEQRSSALLAAIEYKAFEIVDLLINAGARLNDGYSRPPGTILGAAIELGDRSLISKLLSAGAKVLKWSQIRRIGNHDTAAALQKIGSFQNILQASGQRILAAALLTEDENLTQYLLEHNADLKGGADEPRSSMTRMTPLEAAIRANNIGFTEVLLNRGAMVTDGDIAAALDAKSECLPNLLSKFRGSAPTAVGTAICHEESLEIFRDAGVDPTGAPRTFKDSWHRGFYTDEYEEDSLYFEPLASVLEIAVLFKSREYLQFLLHWVYWDKMLTGRALAIATFIGQDELANELLEFGADGKQEITVKTRFYEKDNPYDVFTPLQAAVKNQMFPIAEKLVRSVDVNYLGMGARRRTPLQHAVENGNMDLINLLLQHGASVDSPPAQDGGATALQIAAIQGYIGIARRLIDLGANVNEPPAIFNGRTALQGAAEHGRIDMLQMLLNEGALVVGDGEQNYQRAIQLGERRGHGAAVRLLRSFRESVQLSTPEAFNGPLGSVVT
ncbi:uncharacterized protein BHQ10_005352 [Talaromyces amestolkiae]|uniref:Clr5 domain-containing protein n=1 Tax=Talaromyces amestolkiae TaxID=1196081 RepID=A0A364L0L5_TALAM|nr:uncharacterized protein BHQ10_005352 [Talaromyces amestolkiae]RAO69340.1 hypothetical protein BHQ10_005352 [Talaromyces amestolkiae]